MAYEDVEGDEYQGIHIIPEDLAETLDDFGKGHYLDDTTYTTAGYAARAGLKVGIGPNYLLLVRVPMNHGRTGWQVFITTNDVMDMFEGEEITNE